MKLTREEREMLDGRHGEAPRRAMDALVQLGEVYGAEDMFPLGSAHVHPGMALYARDVDLLEDLARFGAKVSVPTSANAVYDGFGTTPPGSRRRLRPSRLPTRLPAGDKEYARLLTGKRAAPGVMLWIATSRAVRSLASQEGILPALESANAAVTGRFVPRRAA